MKKLYRSRTEKKISGVCGGIAMYFNLDPTIIRLVWAFVSVFSVGIPGVLIYVICALVIPEEPDAFETTGSYHDDDNC
jgi:phage shock protein C